jgi:hypothetical protein
MFNSYEWHSIHFIYLFHFLHLTPYFIIYKQQAAAAQQHQSLRPSPPTLLNSNNNSSPNTISDMSTLSHFRRVSETAEIPTTDTEMSPSTIREKEKKKHSVSNTSLSHGDTLYWRIEPSGLGNIGLQNAIDSVANVPLSSSSSLVPLLQNTSDSSALDFLTNQQHPQPQPQPQLQPQNLLSESTPSADPTQNPTSPLENSSNATTATPKPALHLDAVWVGAVGRVPMDTWSENTKNKIRNAMWEGGVSVNAREAGSFGPEPVSSGISGNGGNGGGHAGIVGGGRAPKRCVPVFLTEEEMEGHYNQFCKQVCTHVSFFFFISFIPLYVNERTNVRCSGNRSITSCLIIRRARRMRNARGDSMWL